MKENIGIFDFTLSKEDTDRIDAINQDEHLCWNPNTVV